MGSIQVETIQEELNRDVNEDKQKQIEEMKRLNAQRLEVLSSREEILRQLLQLSICREAVARELQAQQSLLYELRHQFEEASRQKTALKKKKEETEAKLSNKKAELKRMRVGPSSVRDA